MRTTLAALTLERPRDERTALTLMAASDAPTPIAGGTDLYVTLHAGSLRARRFLDLSRLAKWRGITTDAHAATIGALTTFHAIREHAVLRRRLPALIAAAAEVGAWPIQSRATIGGNIANASPAGDSLPVLLAHDAVLELRSLAGVRHMPIADFFVGYRTLALAPGELVARVHIAFPPRADAVFFRKVGTRRAQSISKVVFCGRLRRDSRGKVTEARLAFGSMAAMPVRARGTEAVLLGRKPAEALADAQAALARELTPIDDIRSEAAYRREVAGRLLEQWVRTLGGVR